MNIHALAMLLLMAFTSQMVEAEPQCVATSDVATTCDPAPAPTSKCEACSVFNTNKTACDALTCTSTGPCSDDCDGKNNAECTTAAATCDWQATAICQGGCDGLVENTCTTAAGCRWNTETCSPPGDCTANTQQLCTDGGCTWTPGGSPECDGTPDGTCAAHTTSGACLTPCTWAAATPSCVNSATCSTHNADDTGCDGEDGCLWVAATSCTNKKRCEYKDANDCDAADNGCTYSASSCSDMARASACTDHTTQNACCSDSDGCAWVECADNGSGGVMPSLLLLLLLPVNLLIRF